MSESKRRGVLTMFTLLAGTLLMLAARPALAEHRTLYVDAATTKNGDGSRHRPFWRITDAVVRARELRQDDSDPEERIVIHVRPGTYVGSYVPAHLANNPRLELLPIIVNVSNLRIEGRTEFDEDEEGLPTGTYSLANETLLTADEPLGRGQVLLLIASTADGMAGNRGGVSGFVMDGGARGAVGFDIYADRVSDFSIQHNLLRRAGGGIQTRLASGTFEANFCTANNQVAIFITGGSLAQPARVSLRRNRSTQNGFGGATVGAVASFVQLDLGANTLRLEPLQTTYDINNAHDQQNIPNTLDATVEGNDFSDNSIFGLRCGFHPPFSYSTVDPTQPITGSLNVTVRANTFNRNADYGISVDALSSNRTRSRQLSGNFEGTFENNVLIDNGRNTSVFGFTHVEASIGLHPRQDWKYMQAARFQVTDLDGELEGFDYDHPLNDPFDGSPVVGNVLVVNGQVQPNGIQITPRH